MDQRERWEDPQEAMRSALDGRQATMWTALPGIIQSVDADGTVSVSPAIKARMVTKAGVFSDVNLPLLIHCPLVTPGGGGFALTLPVAVGDEVLVVFASRCIDGWWQYGGVQPQVEYRMHDLSDGFAIPAYLSQPMLPGSVSANTAQLRSKDGLAYVELGAGHKVNIVSPGDVTITGNLKVTGEITAGFGTGDSVTLQQHKHGTGAAAAGTSVPTAGT